MTERHHTLRDDTGSLPLALLLSLVAISLSALMTPLVLRQVDSTRVDARRVHALHAAQAGLDVGMGRIRAADDGTGIGVLTKLPCGSFTGTVSAAGTARYEVLVDYFSVNPQGKNDAWILANRISCIAGGGTVVTPTYALLRSRGTDSATGAVDSVPGRSLRATYTFKTTNQNIAGGLIHAYNTGSSLDLCMDAGTGAPAAGTALQMRACDPNAISQLFAYSDKLAITLVTSKTAAAPTGMCVDAGTPGVSGAVARLQPCSTSNTGQQWSVNDSANLEGTNPITGGLSGRCLNVQTPNVPGSLVVLGACGGGYSNVRTFSLDAAVGAGAAGPESGQFVNFSQFGRCLDVTEFNVNKGYLIVWPCKQAPNPANVGWNQKWAVPTGAGQITTVDSGGVRYCLRSPGTTVPRTYVTVIRCPATPTPEVTWNVTKKTDSYATSYVAVDYRGKCLTPTDPKATPADLYEHGQFVSKVAVANCDGSTLQKWNAPENILQPLPLKDITER